MATLKNINVSACDNELIILDYQWGASFLLGTVLSGNSNSVSVNINMSAGPYSGSSTWNGVNSPLTVTTQQNLPTGTYSLLLLGIDWGGPQQFTVTLTFSDGTTANYSLPYGTTGEGLVWNSVPIAITL